MKTQQYCKAHLHTKLPEHRSEKPFAEALLNLNFPQNNKPHVWFIKIPGMKDVDAVIWLPRTGLFILEMKSWPLSAITHISSQRFELDETIKHSTSKSPWEQVQNAEQQFSSRLKSDQNTNKALGFPWSSSMVALYRIRRSDFEEIFKGESGVKSEEDYKTLLSNSTIFAEDLASGEVFIERLRFSRYKPVFGQAPHSGPNAVFEEVAVSTLHDFIDPHLVVDRPTSAYDRKRVDDLENETLVKINHVSWEKTIVCTGYAGTGKTFLGLRTALKRLDDLREQQHGLSTGLFVCFNKVLATDIRRLLDLSPKFRKYEFDAQDIFSLISLVSSNMGTKDISNYGNPDIWADQKVKHIISMGKHEIKQKWDIIVVDESQDLQDWAWDLLDYISNGSNNLFVINGKNQLLYRKSEADYLSLIIGTAKTVENKGNYLQQRRVFRTTDTTFLISQLFMETYPSYDEANKLWNDKLKHAYEAANKKSVKNNHPGQLIIDLPDFDLPRRGGFGPRLVSISESGYENIITRVTNTLINAYKKTRDYYRDSDPSSLLILVPFRSRDQVRSGIGYDWADIARKACQQAGFRFIDYTDDSERRRAHAGDEVRICTFHSSRGIEGLHSVILGFDNLAEAAADNDWRVSNLGYIVLSRSLFDTDILYVEDRQRERKEVDFLRAIIEIVGK